MYIPTIALLRTYKHSYNHLTVPDRRLGATAAMMSFLYSSLEILYFYSGVQATRMTL